MRPGSPAVNDRTPDRDTGEGTSAKRVRSPGLPTVGASSYHDGMRRTHPLVHETAMAVLTVTHMRDRLRCPACSAVGTWKPHGGVLVAIFQGDEEPRRWLCKWCGFYDNEDHVGMFRCVVDTDLGVWREIEAKPDGLTPAKVLAGSPLIGTWPWRG